jgi:hypothetical protein
MNRISLGIAAVAALVGMAGAAPGTASAAPPHSTLYYKELAPIGTSYVTLLTAAGQTADSWIVAKLYVNNTANATRDVTCTLTGSNSGASDTVKVRLDPGSSAAPSLQSLTLQILKPFTTDLDNITLKCKSSSTSVSASSAKMVVTTVVSTSFVGQ